MAFPLELSESISVLLVYYYYTYRVYICNLCMFVVANTKLAQCCNRSPVGKCPWPYIYFQLLLNHMFLWFNMFDKVFYNIIILFQIKPF